MLDISLKITEEEEKVLFRIYSDILMIDSSLSYISSIIKEPLAFRISRNRKEVMKKLFDSLCLTNKFDKYYNDMTIGKEEKCITREESEELSDEEIDNFQGISRVVEELYNDKEMDMYKLMLISNEYDLSSVYDILRINLYRNKIRIAVNSINDLGKQVILHIFINLSDIYHVSRCFLGECPVPVLSLIVDNKVYCQYGKWTISDSVKE